MRLPSQREPSRSLLGRPRCGGSLGRCENEGLQPRPGRQKAYRQTDRQTGKLGFSGGPGRARVTQEGVSEVPLAPRQTGGQRLPRPGLKGNAGL